MARDVSEGLPTGPPGRARRLRDVWSSLARRWPRPLRLRRPRVTRLRLAVLGVVAVLVVLWGAVAVASTSIYSAQVMVVTPEEPVGLPPPGELDFGDLPLGTASEKKIAFENNGRIPTGVVILEWGGIGDLMGISDAFFTLDPGDEKEVTFRVEPPPSALPQGAEEKGYSGRVIVLRMPWWTPW